MESKRISKRKRLRVSGFLTRMHTKKGRKTISSKRRHGRRVNVK